MALDKNACAKGVIEGLSVKVMDNMAIKEGDFGIKPEDGTIGGRCTAGESKDGCKNGVTYKCQASGMEGTTYIWCEYFHPLWG